MRRSLRLSGILTAMVAVLTATISPVGADASLARPASVRLAAAFQTPDFAITQYDVTLSDAGGGAFAAPPNLGGAGLASELVGGRSLAPRAGLELDGRSEMLIVDPGHEATLAFRSQTAGRWSDWLTLETPLDEAPDGLPGEEGSLKPSTAIGPIWIGEGAERVEFVGLEGNIERVSVEALASLDLDNAGPPVGAALPGQPTIQPRSAWATKGFATQNEGCEDGPQPATNIRAAIVHHTVTGNDYAIGAVDDMLRAIYRLHVDINGWCDIAYNFVVDRFGNIWQARSGDVEAPIIGGHARGFNTWTVGIALLGQHQPGASPAAAVPTSAAMGAVQALIGWKLGLHGVDPSGTTWLRNRASSGVMKFPSDAWVEVPTIIGHRDVGVTSCPGSNTTPLLAGIRTALRAGRVGQPPYSFVAHEPYEHGPGFVTLDAVGGLRPAGSANQPLGELVPSGATAIAVDGGPSGGYVLTSASMLIDYGAAPTVSGATSGATPARDLVVTSSGRSGWVLDANGGLHAFGGAPPRSGAVVPGSAVALELDDNGRGYIVMTSGQLVAVGGAPNASLAAPLPGTAVAVAVRGDGASGWVLDAAGSLHRFGDAPDWQPSRKVTGARAVLVGDNDRGGWVLDAEGRLTPFGTERRVLPVSTTVGVPTAVDGALVDWIRDDRSDLVRFATAITELFLGAPPTPDEADWIGVRSVWESRSAVAGDLARSDAWAGRIIDQMYNDVLGRPADAAGRAYWLDRIRRGLRTQDLGANFYASPEYVASGGDAAGYVRLLYRALLGREADNAGLAYWVEQLTTRGARPGDITLGFYQSPESRNGRVADLYQRVLRRAPEEAGLAFWSMQLQRVDDIALAIELSSSVEYYTLVTS